VLRGDFAVTTIITGLSGLALLLLTISRGALVAVFAICALATLMRRRTFTTALLGATAVCVAGFAYALKAGDPAEKVAQYLLTFAIMLAVAIVISELTGSVRRQAKAQAALAVEAETERIRNALLASISHDLRTPSR
jgi:two-component system sensor histidine kinase KdpD